MRFVVQKAGKVVADGDARRVTVGKKRGPSVIRVWRVANDDENTIVSWADDEWDTIEIVDGEHRFVTVKAAVV
jgi:hypothetical protein